MTSLPCFAFLSNLFFRFFLSFRGLFNKVDMSWAKQPDVVSDGEWIEVGARKPLFDSCGRLLTDRCGRQVTDTCRLSCACVAQRLSGPYYRHLPLVFRMRCVTLAEDKWRTIQVCESSYVLSPYKYVRVATWSLYTSYVRVATCSLYTSYVRVATVRVSTRLIRRRMRS
jgi:hypothetical protein